MTFFQRSLFYIRKVLYVCQLLTKSKSQVYYSLHSIEGVYEIEFFIILKMVAKKAFSPNALTRLRPFASSH